MRMATISTTSKIISKVRDVLAERSFSEQQITKLLPRLHEKMFEEPKYLSEIIDRWNILLSSAGSSDSDLEQKQYGHVPPVAKPPRNCSLVNKIDMTNILADVEPDLLLMDPEKLVIRQDRIRKLSISKNLSEEWLLLFNAPRGVYLQDWIELTKKVYYVEEKIIDFLYDKKERKAMVVHPLVKSAAVTETDFNHIRTRYLFALRSGYKSLGFLYTIQTALDKPSVTDLILADNEWFLRKFASYCSLEEYNSFSDLVKNHDIDEDDAEIFEELAKLNSLTSSSKQLGRR